MASPGTLRRVALVRTDVSEELSTSFIRVTRIRDNIPEDAILLWKICYIPSRFLLFFKSVASVVFFDVNTCQPVVQNL
jgi:hypothetical protein